MLLETELTRDQDRPGAPWPLLSAASVGLGVRAPANPLASSLGRTTPKGEMARTAESGRGTVGREGPRTQQRKEERLEKHYGGRGAAPIRDGNRNGGGNASLADPVDRGPGVPCDGSRGRGLLWTAPRTEGALQALLGGRDRVEWGRQFPPETPRPSALPPCPTVQNWDPWAGSPT